MVAQLIWFNEICMCCLCSKLVTSDPGYSLSGRCYVCHEQIVHDNFFCQIILDLLALSSSQGAYIQGDKMCMCIFVGFSGLPLAVHRARACLVKGPILSGKMCCLRVF